MVHLVESKHQPPNQTTPSLYCLSIMHHSNTLQKHLHTFLLETYTANTQKEKPINANCYIRFITKCRYSCKLSYHVKPILFHQELPTTTSKKSRSPSRSGGVQAKRKKWEKGNPRKESWVTTLLVVQWSVCRVKGAMALGWRDIYKPKRYIV